MSDTQNLFFLFLQCSFVQTNWVKHCHFIGCLYWLTGAVASALVKQKLAQVILKKQKQAVLERTNSNPQSTASVAYRLEATLVAAHSCWSAHVHRSMCLFSSSVFWQGVGSRSQRSPTAAPALLQTNSHRRIRRADEPETGTYVTLQHTHTHESSFIKAWHHHLHTDHTHTHTHLGAGGRAGRSAGVCVCVEAFQRRCLDQTHSQRLTLPAGSTLLTRPCLAFSFSSERREHSRQPVIMS